MNWDGFFCTFIIMKNVIYVLILCASVNFLTAQSFIKNNQSRALSFKEMQLQFNAYKKQNDLTKVKGWKNFKRWENEMQLHTNTQGEPSHFDTYINEIIAEGNLKQQQSAIAPSVWSPSGPNVLPNNLTGYMENGIGRINCIAFHPTNSSTYFVGVAQGGLWKTTNDGASWTPLTDNLPITRISDISIDPANPNTMYISVCDFEYIGFGLFLNGRKRHTHYGLGVYKTTDGGATWSPTGLTYQLTNGDESLIRKILINPTNSNEVLACGANGMHKSTNGGATWTKLLDSLFWDMVPDPVNPNIVYAATGWVLNSNQGEAAVYKSTNFGNTWVKLNTAIPPTGSVQRVKLAIAPSDPNYIYALCVDTQNGLYGFYKSTNAGLNWTYISPSLNVLDPYTGTGPGGQGNYDLGFIVHPTNKNTVYVGGVNLWGSTDGAVNFDPIAHWTTSYGPTIHGDIHYIDRQPSTGRFFVCSDGGVYRTSSMVIGSFASNFTTNWANLNNGLQVTSFYRLSSSKNASGRLCAGAQDNATFYYKSGVWSTIFGGDGMDNYLDPLNNNNVFGSSQYGNFYESTNNGMGSNYPNTNPNSEAAEWVTPVVADYNHPGVLYIGNENVVKSTDNGNTWTALSPLPGSNSSEISALAVSNTHSLILYAARRVRYESGIPGAVFNTNNGGLTWTNITAGLPDSLYCTGIEINETNPSIAYVCMAGFSSGRKVYMTTNGGMNWTNISYNLPNLPVNCIKQIPGTNNIMVATDVGVYVLYGSTTTWVNNSMGLPNVIVSDIEFNSALNKAYVSTFGRGIWETSLSVLSGINENQTSKMSDFNLYPSVNNGSFTITFDSEPENMKLEIINVMGQIVFQKILSNKETKINIELVSGAYYARVSDNKKLAVRKFVVE